MSVSRGPDLTLERVREYILYLRGRPAFIGHPFLAARERPLSDASVNSYVRGQRGFASWLYEQEYTDINVLGRLKAPKMTKKVVDVLNTDIARYRRKLTYPAGIWNFVAHQHEEASMIVTRIFLRVELVFLPFSRRTLSGSTSQEIRSCGRTCGTA